MGLDMYLTRKTYVDNNDYMPDSYKFEIKIKDVHGNELNTNKVSGFFEEVGYWRKVNAIHKWFVDNVQDGNDDCGSYYVPKEKLVELLDIVNKILDDNSRAQELLPTQDGFFFGSIEYDEYYFDDLKRTKEILEKTIAYDGAGEYYYHSSW